MKSLNKPLLVLISLLITINSFAQKMAILEGVITNAKYDTIKVILLDDLLSKSPEYKSRISSKGEFKIVIPINEGRSAWLHTDKLGLEMFITPGDTIHCQFDNDSVMNSIVFDGNRATQYNYFVKYYQKFGFPHAMYFKPDKSDVFKMSAVEFKEYRKNKVESDLMFLNNYCSSYKATNEFKLYIEIEIRYSYYYALLSYANFRKYFIKTDDILPNDFYNDINKELFLHDDYLISQNYLNAMNLYMSTLKIGPFSDVNIWYRKAFRLSIMSLENKSLLWYQSRLIVDLMQSDAKSVLKDSIYREFLNICPYDEYNNAVKQAVQLSQKAEEILIPKDVLKTILITTDGKEISIETILSKNKDKIIYIDFWASFCGPCFREMPYSKKLFEKYKDKPVKFLYFSTDEKPESWKKAIVNWKLVGEQYLIKDQTNSELCKHFNIVGVPHYILIDKKGGVIFPFAPRPSSLGIESSINASIND